MIGSLLAILWKEWPKDMEAVTLGDSNFTLIGNCPHCSRDSVFVMKTGAHVETLAGYSPPQHRIVAVL
jgi:hypothetical protein